jgi:hypothetical protein
VCHIKVAETELETHAIDTPEDLLNLKTGGFEDLKITVHLQISKFSNQHITTSPQL